MRLTFSSHNHLIKFMIILKIYITFVYIFIFIVGMAIVFFMTSYINKAAKSVDNEVAITSE